MHISMRWMSAIVLISLFSCCSRMEDDIDGSAMRTKEKGVYGYLTPVEEDDLPATRANVTDAFKYRFETGDRINIWSESGTLLVYKVKELIDDGAGASFEGGGFDLTEGETYYSSHPLIRDVDEDCESLTTTYEGEKQTENGVARHLAKYYYTYASAPCTNGNTSFTYRNMSSFLRFVVTVPKEMTLTELTLTADNPVFSLSGKTNMKTGVYTADANKMSDVMTLALDDIALEGDELVLRAFMAIAPCDAANYIVRLKDSEGKIYTSPVVAKSARAANKITTFEVDVVAGENPMICRIGEVGYPTLADAVAAVPADGTATTIIMLADHDVIGNAGITIATGKNVILDLNSKTVTLNITESKASQLFKNNGILTITDSSSGKTGKLTNAPGEGLDVGDWPELNFATNIIANSGTLNMQEGTIVNNAQGSICYAIDNNSTSYDAVLNMVGGTITGTTTLIRQFCNSTTKQNVLNISGGTIETTGYSALWTQLPGSSESSKKLATLNITGGVVKGGSYAWYDYSDGDSFEAVNYSISGGELYGYLYSYAVGDGVKPGFITGGLFSEDPRSLCAPGMISTASADHPGMYEVGEADVYYYWYEGDERDGGYYSFYAPFEGPSAILMDGEFIELLHDIVLTKDVAFAETCSWGDPISVGGTFSLTFGDYDIDLNGFAFPLPTGVSVKTDKQTDIFSAAEDGKTIVETEISEGDFHYQYSVASFVAQIGDTKYSTLAEAIAAVPTGTPTTITMISDETVDVANAALTVAAGKNIILELAGHSVVGNCSSAATSALITNKGTLTIQDNTDTNLNGTGNGKLISGADPTWTWDGSDDYAGSYASNLIRNEGTLVVESGLLYNVSTGSAAYAVDNYSAASLTVNGGNLDAKKASAVRMFYQNGGSVTVNGGVIGGDSNYMGVQVMSTGANGVTVNVTGGTFKGSYSLYAGSGTNSWSTSQFNISGGVFESTAGFAGAISADVLNVTGGEYHTGLLSWGDAKFIKGGKFTEEAKSQSINCLAEGYKFVEDGDYYIVVEMEPVATVNDVPYKTLKAALEAVGAGPGTIKLIANVDLGTEGLVVGADQEVTIALGNYSITGAVNGKLITNNGILTFTGSNGTVYNTDVSAQGHDAVYNAAGATLSIKGGHFGDSDTDKTNANSINRGGAVRNFGTAVISGGTYTACDNFTNGGYAYAIINDGEGDLTFSSGTVYGHNNGNFAVNDGTVLIKGGTFTVSGAQSYNCVYNEVGDVTITGGNFRKENHESQGAAQKAILRLEGNGSFAVSSGTYYGGAINDSYIESGYQQVTFESAGETVRQVLGQTSVNTSSDLKLTTPGIYVLESDLTVNTTYAGGVMSSGYTEIDLNGHDLVLNGNGRPAFNFRNKQVAVINGPGSVTSNTNDYSCVMANGNDVVVTINGGDFTANANGSECIYCYSGNIIINGGTFKVTGENASFLLNCYDSNRAAGKAWITVKGGTFWDFDPSNNSAEGANTNFVAQGYHVVSDSSSQPGHVLYTVVAN